MVQTSVINDLLNAIGDTGLFGERRRRRIGREEVSALIAALLTGRGEASSTERAAEVLATYRDLDGAGRTFVFRTLLADYGPDTTALTTAAERYLAEPGHSTAKALQRAALPQRVEFFRRINNVQGGTQALVAMRCELMDRMAHHPDLWVVDDDLKRLLIAWFNRGFLTLRAIDWQTSAAVLEKIIRYESVHAINGWDDLRRRIDVPDRKLFGFFHPRLGDEPLIFVEVALTTQTPRAIGPILSGERTPIRPEEATTAVFYSINNCQEGLRGISLGNFLIKQVVADLTRDYPNLKTFVTLSPVPTFRAWLEGPEAPLTDETRATPEASLAPLAAHYLTAVKDARGRPLDPVARFHLGNGATLAQINPGADGSARGLAASHGLMVNYRYALSDIEANHEAFVNGGAVSAAPAIAKLARSVRPSPDAAPLPAPV
ncbi:MAG: malonyl-CoA decarboxylase [Pseudomonadota bacterium]